MVNNTLNALLRLASLKKAEKITISHNRSNLSFQIEIPFEEDLLFSFSLKKADSIVKTFKKLLKIAPDELINNQYFKLQGQGYDLSFNLNIVITKEGEKIVINLKNPEKQALSLNQLGLDLKSRKNIINILNKKRGLIVLASAPRQGLSTSLEALLLELDKSDQYNIYYFSESEDLKNEYNNVIQASNKNIYWDSLASQNADIVVAELSNKKTDIKSALNLANTGRLVIISLNASNAMEALHLLLSNSQTPALVLDNLKIIVAQKLVELKRTKNEKHFKISKDKRREIALFEYLSLNKNTKKFITDNFSKIKTKEFWYEFLNLSLNKAYTPFLVDEKRKSKDGII